MPNNCGFRRLTNIEQGTARSTSHMIATVLVTVLEGQLGNARFVEFAQPFRDHSVVLLFGGPSERKIQLKFAREIERDTAVFGGVRGREKTAMFAALHVFAFRLQNARGRAGFRKNFAQYCKIKAHRFANAKILRIAASSLTTVIMTSDSAVTSERSWQAAQRSSSASFVAAARFTS